MKKSKFTNKIFYWILVVSITILLIYNVCNFFFHSSVILLVHISLQVLILGFILLNHHLLKNTLKIWAVGSLIIAPILGIVGKLLIDTADGFVEIDYLFYLRYSCFVLLGIVLFEFTNDCIEIVDSSGDNEV